jgi:RNA polymerase sigma factor (sigma-70 family)
LWRVIVLRIPDNPKFPDTPAPALFEPPRMLPEAISDPPPVPPRRDIDEQEFVRLYDENCGVLVALAIRKFRVPLDDAEGLAHEVFLSYLKRRDEIRDLHRWLVGAICNASRYYWRQRGRHTEQLDTEIADTKPDPATGNMIETMMARIAAGEAMAGLSPRYQHILRLRYFEGYSIKEIADHLGVTSKYTQKLVTKCLRRAEEIFSRSQQGKKE